MSDEVWAHFDAGDAEGIYASFSAESKKLLDHNQFVQTVTAAWRKANALDVNAANARNRSPLLIERLLEIDLTVRT